jgi:hypothetical protein
MQHERHDLPINKGLLDASGTGRTLSALRTQFLPVDFFDFCSIVEEVVLRDEIILVGKYTKLPQMYRDALQPFVEAGVFKTMLSSTKILDLGAANQALRQAAEFACQDGLTSSSLKDADYGVTRLLGAEIDLQIPTIPLLQHLHNYQFMRRPKIDDNM